MGRSSTSTSTSFRHPSAAQLQTLLTQLQEADESNDIVGGSNKANQRNRQNHRRGKANGHVRTPVKGRSRRSSLSPISPTGSVSSWTWETGKERIGELKEKSIGIGEKLHEAIPGLRYSTTFLSSLRANIALSSSLCPPDFDSPASISPMASTVLPPQGGGSSEHPSLSGGAARHDPLEGIPELVTYATSSEEEKIKALKLVADSIAQQSKVAAKSLILSRLFLGLMALALGLLIQNFYRSPEDLMYISTTFAGFVMAGFVTVRYSVRGYVFAAETVKWSWLGVDEVIVSKFGDAIIGALIFRIVKEGKRRKGRGEIRAWTVRQRERGRGVGKGLLEVVVTTAMKERGCESLEFVDDHANSRRVLPKFFNKVFEDSEKMARTALDEVLVEQGVKKRSK